MWYKNFADQPEQALNEYKLFWFNEFPRALRAYYPFVSHDGKMILGADRRSNHYVGVNMIQPSEMQYCFSVSVFFHVLLPQVVAKTFGREAAAAFHDASGWMRVSAGLGGNVGAEHWIYESGDLYPMEKEVIYYNALIDAVLQFQKKEMLDFLKGGQPSLDPVAYDSLCKMASGSLEEFERNLDEAVEAAKVNFAKGEHPVYFLPQEMLYY